LAYGGNENQQQSLTIREYGNVEKSRQRRSRHFAVHTYSMYASRIKQWLPPAGMQQTIRSLAGRTFLNIPSS
jgi:hypothetical protein